MALRKDIRAYARQVVGPTLAVSVFAYFAYHAVEGDRGLLAWIQLEQDVDSAQAELAKVSRAREALAHQTELLRSDGLDPDMLDERARSILGVIRKDEIIIVAPPAGDHQSEIAPSEGRLVALAPRFR
jgi:cell division protein FtsB